MSNIKNLIFICLFLPLIFQPANSEVYKWIDDDGRVIYGDRPDTDNAKTIVIKKNKSETDNQLKERKEKRKKLLDVMKQEREDKISQKEKEKEEKEKHEKECAELNGKLSELKEAPFLYEDTDDPFNPKILTVEEHKIEIKKMEEYINENC